MQRDERDLLKVLKVELNSSKMEAMAVRRELLGGLNIFSKTLSLA